MIKYFFKDFVAFSQLISVNLDLGVKLELMVLKFSHIYKKKIVLLAYNEVPQNVLMAIMSTIIK